MSDRSSMIFESGGSNVDLPSHAELDGVLSDLHFMYDDALDQWHEADKEHREAKVAFEEIYAKKYSEHKLESDKITQWKKDTEMDPSVRRESHALLRAEGARDYCERVIKKIESQRSMIQSRIKLLLSQVQWDRSGPE